MEDYFQVKLQSEFYFPLTDFMTFNTSVLGGFSEFGNRESAGYFTGGFTEDIDKNFISFKGLFPGDIISRNIISADAEIHFTLNRIFIISPFYSRLFYNFPDSIKTVNSFGSSLAVISPIGPIEIAAAQADSKDLPVIYLNAGFNF